MFGKKQDDVKKTPVVIATITQDVTTDDLDYVCELIDNSYDSSRHSWPQRYLFKEASRAPSYRFPTPPKD